MEAREEYSRLHDLVNVLLKRYKGAKKTHESCDVLERNMEGAIYQLTWLGNLVKNNLESENEEFDTLQELYERMRLLEADLMAKIPVGEDVGSRYRAIKPSAAQWYYLEVHDYATFLTALAKTPALRLSSGVSAIEDVQRELDASECRYIGFEEKQEMWKIAFRCRYYVQEVQYRLARLKKKSVVDCPSPDKSSTPGRDGVSDGSNAPDV